jgi:hypothetical protein
MMVKLSMVKLSMVKLSMVKVSMVKLSEVKLSMVKLSMVYLSLGSGRMVKLSRWRVRTRTTGGRRRGSRCIRPWRRGGQRCVLCVFERVPCMCEREGAFYACETRRVREGALYVREGTRERVHHRAYMQARKREREGASPCMYASERARGCITVHVCK